MESIEATTELQEVVDAFKVQVERDRLILSVLIMQFALMKQVDKTIEARSSFLNKVQEKISEANSLVATENANRVLEEAADE